MPRTLEIPPIETVKKMPEGGRAWMYARTYTHGDVSLEINCEPVGGEGNICHAGLTLRTRSGDGGYSYNTGRAIGHIMTQNEPSFPELPEGQNIWRPAERSNGIIMIARKTRDSVLLTIVNAREKSQVTLSTEKVARPIHTIHLEEIMFRRFLALGGAMEADWRNVGDPAQRFRGMSLEQALENDRDFFFD